MAPLFSKALKGYLSYCEDFPWYPTTSTILVDHVLTKFLPNLNDDGLIPIISLLNDLAEEWVLLFKRSIFADGKDLETQQNDMHEKMTEIFLESFIPKLQRFFIVPELEQLSGEDKSLMPREILAGFMHSLLEILDSESTFHWRYQKRKYALLCQKLTFLLTILGDNTTFQCTEVADVKNLLLEFKYLANETGRFIYYYVFAPSVVLRRKNFDAGIGALLEKFDAILDEKIKEHCFKLAEIPMSATSSRSNYFHSLYILDSLVKDLESLIYGRLNLVVYHMNDQVKTLIQELTLLKGIEMPQVVTTNYELKESLVRIIDLAYEAEYLINTRLVGHIPTWYLNLRLPAVVHEIKLSRTRLQEIKRIEEVNDVKIVKDFNICVKNPEIVLESIVMGFEDITDNILSDLIRGSKKLQTISIVGMPGIGKSTIAKKLHNNSSVYGHFDLRVWCVVSQAYEKKKVLNDILMSLKSKSGKNNIVQKEAESLGLEIYQSLYKRRYLIIMDDIWYSSTWDEFRRYFPDDENGSRILFTSRIKDTAPTGSIFHEPPLLSDSQCFDLLVKKVFINELCPPQLLDIAKVIASKCHGLPLAVVVVAGMLANLGMEESMWKNIERNLASYISDDQVNYMKILELSYEHLPYHLKPCFLYLGACSEDREIQIRKVIPLWISEGFVDNREDKSLEHVAEEYLLDLLNRSLLMIVERRSDGGIKACSIHDLLRDMCIRKAEEETFLKHVYVPSSVYEKHSHLTLHMPETWGISALHCRSLYVQGYISAPKCRVTQMAPLLRVIRLEKVDSYFNRARICSLIHLRYLSFAAAEIPKEICKLVNLRNLHIKAHTKVFVPSVIMKMAKLRHVCINGTAVFRLPKRKTRHSSLITNNLKSLSFVSITCHKQEQMLNCSPHLQKLKCICEGSFFPSLVSFNELESLTMVFNSGLRSSFTRTPLPSTIKKLSLTGTLILWEEISVVGRLPNLQVLKLGYDAFFGDHWSTKDDEFQELRLLRLERVYLNQWTTCSEHFPKLERLILDEVWSNDSCELEIPSEIGEIPTLQTIEVRNCQYKVSRSAVEIEKQQREYGNEDLKVTITSKKWTKNKLLQHLQEEVDPDAGERDEDGPGDRCSVQ